MPSVLEKRILGGRTNVLKSFFVALLSLAASLVALEAAAAEFDQAVLLPRASADAPPVIDERKLISLSHGAAEPRVAEAEVESSYQLQSLRAAEVPDQLARVVRPGVLRRDGQPTGLAENLSLFGGLDGSKQPQDLGVNANMGGRFAANWGFALFEDFGIGLQIGTSLNYSANAVRVLDRIEGTATRFQNFSTIGVFQRSRLGLNWAIAYDYLAENYYDRFDLSQWRGLVGYELNQRNEVGVWYTVADRGANGFYKTTPVHLKPISMGNAYWRHTWASCAQTMLWMGMAEGHGRVNVALGDLGRTGNTFVYGAQLFVPLNDSLAVFGQANMITPASTGTVDAFLGFSFYPGRSARSGFRGRFSPMLPVANSPMFAVDMSR